MQVISLIVGGIIVGAIWAIHNTIINQNKTDHKTWVSISMRTGSDLYTTRMLIKLTRLYNKLYDIRLWLPILDSESRKMRRMEKIIENAQEYVQIKINKQE